MKIFPFLFIRKSTVVENFHDIRGQGCSATDHMVLGNVSSDTGSKEEMPLHLTS